MLPAEGLTKKNSSAATQIPSAEIAQTNNIILEGTRQNEYFCL